MSLTWVVGGTSGIGAACAKVLKEIDGHEVMVSGHDVDVRYADELFAFLASKRNRSSIDNIIYSAGITELDWSMDIDTEKMLDIYNVNVCGLINVLQMVPMVKRVVVIGSDAAWREMRTSAAYCASKAALHTVVRVIARERAAEDFAINVVAPGITEPTKMQEYIDLRVPIVRKWTEDRTREYEESQIPMKRRANVVEIAGVVVTVLLMPTPYLNGAIIPVNGGR